MIFKIDSLTIKNGDLVLVDDVSIELSSDKIVALIGKSGSGKTLTVSAINQMIPSNLSAKFELFLDDKKLDKKLVKRLFSNIMQNPRTAFNPLHAIKFTVKESLKALNLKFDKDKILEIFNEVNLSSDVYDMYPFELSGGMLQRVMIAIALLQETPFLIADEPTTDLDLLVQKNVLDILKKINKGILIITHDAGVVAKLADEVYVMDSGKIVEFGSSKEIFYSPKCDATKRLLKAHFDLY